MSRGYTEVRPIGKGSFGVATLVQDRTGHFLVMKSVDIRRLDSRQQADAVNEVKVLASLKHPYIVRYQESFLENGMLAILMEYAANGDLLQRIERARKKHQAFTEPQILVWFTQVVLGLKYLHGKQILHRDLKSQNLFLTDKDQLRIGDFGISKALKRTALVGGNPIGTPYYLAPEVVTDTMYSFASDIWALACILYEMAVLRVPFEACNFNQLVEKICEGPLPQMPFSYSSDLRLLCRDLFSRDHRKRPLSSDIIRRPVIQKEIARMLREAQENGSEGSPQPTAPPSVAGEEETHAEPHGLPAVSAFPPPLPRGPSDRPSTRPVTPAQQPPQLPDMPQARPATPPMGGRMLSRQSRLSYCGKGLLDVPGTAAPAPPSQPPRLELQSQSEAPQALPRDTLLQRPIVQSSSMVSLGVPAGKGMSALTIKGAMCRTQSAADVNNPAADPACSGRMSPSRRPFGRRQVGCGGLLNHGPASLRQRQQRTLREVPGFA